MTAEKSGLYFSGQSRPPARLLRCAAGPVNFRGESGVMPAYSDARNKPKRLEHPGWGTSNLRPRRRLDRRQKRGGRRPHRQRRGGIGAGGDPRHTRFDHWNRPMASVFLGLRKFAPRPHGPTAPLRAIGVGLFACRRALGAPVFFSEKKNLFRLTSFSA